jgi:hypothetical protein
MVNELSQTGALKGVNDQEMSSVLQAAILKRPWAVGG